MRKNRKAFTMLELLAVVAIISGVVGAVIYKSIEAVRRSRANTFIALVRQVETSILDKIYFVGGTIPLTNQTNLPTTGTLFKATSSTILVRETSLEPYLLRMGIINAFADFPFVPIKYPGSQIQWDTNTNAFCTVPDRTLTATTNLNNAGHFEANITNSTVAPSQANGTNFRLNGIQDLPDNATVVVAVLPNISARDALALAEATVPRELVPALNAGCDAGRVAYQPPDANGQTTVYVYVTHR